MAAGGPECLDLVAIENGRRLKLALSAMSLVLLPLFAYGVSLWSGDRTPLFFLTVAVSWIAGLAELAREWRTRASAMPQVTGERLVLQYDGQPVMLEPSQVRHVRPVRSNPYSLWRSLLGGSVSSKRDWDRVVAVSVRGSLLRRTYLAVGTDSTELLIHVSRAGFKTRDFEPPAVPAPQDPLGWYYILNGQRTGPVPEATLRSLLRAGELEQDVLVWIHDMATWETAGVELPRRASRPTSQAAVRTSAST